MIQMFNGTEPTTEMQMNKPQPYERKILTYCSKISFLAPHTAKSTSFTEEQADNYVPFQLLRKDIKRTSEGSAEMPCECSVPTQYSNPTLERPTPEKHVLISQLVQILAIPDPAEYDQI